MVSIFFFNFTHTSSFLSTYNLIPPLAATLPISLPLYPTYLSPFFSLHSMIGGLQHWDGVGYGMFHLCRLAPHTLFLGFLISIPSAAPCDGLNGFYLNKYPHVLANSPEVKCRPSDGRFRLLLASVDHYHIKDRSGVSWQLILTVHIPSQRIFLKAFVDHAKNTPKWPCLLLYIKATPSHTPPITARTRP